MTAISLGPLVLSSPRFAAGVGLLALVVLPYLLGRRGARLRDWALTAALVVVAGARIGYVAANLRAYLEEPLTIFYLWQGGYSPWAGVAVGAAFALWRAPDRATSLGVGGGALVTWLLVGALLTPAALRDLTLPSTPLWTLQGEPVEVTRVVTGRPSVINLWAPWCLPCRREMPLMVEVAGGHPEVAFLLVDQGSRAEEVTVFLSERDLPLDDVYLDRTAAWGRALRSVGLPTTAFFSADGRLSYLHVGEISRPELRRRVTALVSE